jgi:superfamily II DNA/RNA helicase
VSSVNKQNKKTKTTSIKPSIQKLKVDLNTWNTTDTDEIERRKIRAQIEDFKLENLEPAQVYFSTFCVQTNQNKQYHVEIRSLTKNINSCNCVDHRGNGLGTCKHIEYVLKTLKKKGVRKFAKAAVIGSERIEIYLDILNEHAISIIWPKALPNFASKLIDRFFSADGTLLGKTESTYTALCTAILENQPKLIPHLRVSQHIDYYVQYKKVNASKETARSIFMQDVSAGKRTLDLVKTKLLPYQQEGMLHLAFTERAILADEMGLGKTVQAIAACELLKQTRYIQRVLVVTTASLKAEWEEQIAKFTDSPSMIVYGSRAARLRQYKQQTFFYLMNYEQVVSDYIEIQKTLAPDVVILDEAQRIKNWQTKTASKIKELNSRYAFVLTGTPIENRIDDIYSLVQFLDPHVFGPLFRFYRNFYNFDEDGRPAGYKNLNQMYHKLRPILLCRRKIDVEHELPQRTINNFFVEMDPEQRIRYDENDYQVAIILARAKKRALKKEELEKLQRLLSCMRMICDTPYILDNDCRIAPKIDELKPILEELLADENCKIIIFSEWARMLELVHEMVEETQNIEVAWHTGSVNQKKRREEINRFKTNPKCRLFLSTDAGSVGLNLQVANVVINLDLPWNPAKLEQRIARAWRKNQLRPVQVINLICENSIEHRMLYLLEQKRMIATAVLTDDESLNEMKMPSGRAAFIERLEALMDNKVTADDNIQHPSVKKLPNNAVEHAKNIIVERASVDLDLLNTYQTTPEDKPVLFAVITNDKLDNVENKLKEQLTAEHDISLEMIDAETFAIIQRLAKAGVLTLNTPNAELYDKTSTVAKIQIQKEQINQASHHLDKAARKHRMADVLIQSDFNIEAIPPLREAFTHTLTAFCQLVGEANLEIESFTPKFVKELVNTHNVSDTIDILFNQMIANNKDDILDLDVKKSYNDHKTAMSQIIDMRDKYLSQIHT